MRFKVRSHRPSFTLGILSWLRHRFFRKPLASLFIALFAVLASVLVYQVLVIATSNDWVQTDWSGGVDGAATADDTNLTTWTKYESGTNVDHGTTGEIKLQRTLSTP